MDKSNLYPATFTQEELITKGDTVVLTAGQYTPIGEYVVKADELVGMGRGAYVSQSEAIGRFFAQFKDNADADITQGKLRIMLLSSQDMPIGSKPVFLDVDLASLTTGKSIPADRFTLPFDNIMLSRDKKFQFLVKNTQSADVTLKKTGSVCILDVTRMLV